MNVNHLKLDGVESPEVTRVTPVPAKKPTQTGSTGGPAPRVPHIPRKAKLGAEVLVVLLAVGYGGFRWWDYTRTWVTTDNAYVAGHINTVSTRIAGNVTEVLVSDNQDVAAGGVLARLDANDLKVEHDQALAAVAQAEAQVAQAQAQVTRGEALANKAKLDFDRADRLYREANSAISKQEFDSARAELDSARASLEATKAAVLAAEAQVKVAAAQLADVKLRLSYTEIVAPAAGRVGRKNLEVGNRVQPGQALLAIVQPAVWVTANFKETQLHRLRVGQTVALTVDSFVEREFTGRVESIAPASGAQFALLPPDNATGNFTKIVQRVPVKIVFERATAPDLAGRIVPGMSVNVKVNIRS
mgnify:FL=1